ncbi:MAG: hypothetical protein WCO44_16835 [Bacteroidota bacterium]
MKKALFILFLFCVVPGTQSQSYHPLVQAGKIWSTKYVIEQVWIYSDFKKFEGDTTFGGDTWMKIWTTRNSAMTGWTVTGYIRETASGRVFYKSGPTFAEQLIYDFSMQAGDTATFWGDPNTRYRLDSITQTTLLTGEVRRRYNLSPTGFSCTDHWIEGAGSLLGVLEPASCLWVGGTSELLCFTENDTLKYFNPGYSSCYISTGIEPHAGSNKFGVFQDPVTKKIVIGIDGNYPGGLTFDLVDLDGRLRFTGSVHPGRTEMEMTGIPCLSGLFLVRIRSANTTLYHGKIILKME